ncbi:aldo/keto reductase [Carnobacterium pleistocenium]|uniref:aldo/keto reductase n=1 Tax=Carnobacterium pleistocenium TaxID=181073 RepID=UPI00054D7980|nr:aldo/keto reductase [Carnobacterium pleistocenium]
MKRMFLGKSELMIPNIALGCMSMGNLTPQEASKVVNNALDLEIDFFDLADIYGGGKAEEMFGKVIEMDPPIREKMLIQSKVGIRKDSYDFSKKHLLESVDGVLKRLQTDYLDVLLLHRPDALVEPEVVAEVFDELERSGKVRNFGVSNHNPTQIELLKNYVKQPLVANQMQFSVGHTGMVDAGINVNTKFDSGIDRDGGVLDYSRIEDMTLQAWSPIKSGGEIFVDNANFPEINAILKEIGGRYGLSNSAMAIAWILRHPAHMQAIVGTMTLERLSDYAKASEVSITHDEWYDIYRAAGNKLP